MKHVINISELQFQANPAPMPESVKAKYEGATIARFSEGIGAKKLGYNITAVPAGKRAFPAHNHHKNEEMFFILEGEGEVRIGAETFPIKKGDFIACPPGGPELAHQIINTGKSEMRYVAVSTKEAPEIAEYPDSGKFGVMDETMRFIGKKDQSLNYWDGE